MYQFGKWIAKHRILMLLISALLLIPAVYEYVNLHVNYDILYYLPSDIETMKGQDILLNDFGKGAYAMLVAEDMTDAQASELKEEIEKVDHVADVIWYDSILDPSVPAKILPDEIYDMFHNDNATLMAIFFDTGTSDDETMDAIDTIRETAGEHCFLNSMSAIVTDTRHLVEKELFWYVLIAVIMSSIVLALTMDSFMAPVLFLLNIGMAIIYNMGTNFLQGEISFVTMSLAAVLQLAVTMDYSIFLWQSYNEHKNTMKATKTLNEDAMAEAIHETLVSVIGSSVTTIAGFIALCFMSFTLGKDLGIVMAKGVLLGVLGSVTVLPSMILLLDKPLHHTRHKALIPAMGKISEKLVRIYPAFLVLFVILLIPGVYSYRMTNNEVYYDMGDCLPDYIEYVTAKNKLADEFNIASTHMVLVDSSVSDKDKASMIHEMEKVPGVKFVLGIESLTDARIPEEMLPEDALKMLKSDKWELMMISSEYKVASDKVNDQVDALNTILKKYDPNGMLIGEAPCMKDMIETTGHDFKVVNLVSIIAIFVIILLVEQSLSIPFILIAVIELAIFINLGMAHFLGQSLPFIAPICISTIQLGATVDYAILMTTRYKSERNSGREKREAVITALKTSAPSIIVSGMGLFAATCGVAVYSNIDIIKSMCMLMARGAVVSMACVILILPAMLMLFDGLIRKTTRKMK